MECAKSPRPWWRQYPGIIADINAGDNSIYGKFRTAYAEQAKAAGTASLTCSRANNISKFHHRRRFPMAMTFTDILASSMRQTAGRPGDHHRPCSCANE